MTNVIPVHLLTTSRVLVHPQRANQPKHVQGVPNPEGVCSAQFLSSAAPLPPQGRHVRGADGRGREFSAGQPVRVRDFDGHYLYGRVAHAARSSDHTLFVLVGGDKIPVLNDPDFVVPTS